MQGREGVRWRERENARGGRERECEQLLPNKATV